MAILWVLLNNRIIKRGILCLFFWKILNIPVPRKIHIYTLDILKSSTGNLKGSPATIICFPAFYAEVKILYIKIVFLTLSQVDVYKMFNQSDPLFSNLKDLLSIHLTSLFVTRFLSTPQVLSPCFDLDILVSVTEMLQIGCCIGLDLGVWVTKVVNHFLKVRRSPTISCRPKAGNE